MFALFFTHNKYQSPKSSNIPNEDGNKELKLEKDKVPKEVTESFYLEYPQTIHENWYGYPQYDYGNDWWDDWYDDNTYAYSDNPEYYVVDFFGDSTKQKAIYSKSGKKIAIHKHLISELPRAVSDAINKSEYKNWTIGKNNEEIFEDKNEMKVYKIEVEKGSEKHHLYFHQNGKLLKDKKVQ